MERTKESTDLWERLIDCAVEINGCGAEWKIGPRDVETSYDREDNVYTGHVYCPNCRLRLELGDDIPPFLEQMNLEIKETENNESFPAYT